MLCASKIQMKIVLFSFQINQLHAFFYNSDTRYLKETLRLASNRKKIGFLCSRSSRSVIWGVKNCCLHLIGLQSIEFWLEGPHRVCRGHRLLHPRRQQLSPIEISQHRDLVGAGPTQKRGGSEGNRLCTALTLPWRMGAQPFLRPA